MKSYGAGHTWRRAFSLLEVLIAGLVLAAVMLPLIGLFTSSKTNQQSEDGLSEAVTLAENLMETLLSAQVPFAAIDPGGGGRYQKGGPGGDVVQAAFRDVPSVTALELEALLSDGDETLPDGVSRFRGLRGKTYYLSFFAGKYIGHPGVADAVDPGHQRADIDNTLTFAYLEKPDPVGMPYNLPNPKRDRFNCQIVLDADRVEVDQQPHGIPYLRHAYAVSGGAAPETIELAPETPYFYRNRAQNLPADKRNHRLLTGWPAATRANPKIQYDLDAADQRVEWSRHLRSVVTRSGGQGPTMDYHPIVQDQRTLGMPQGGLMKIVLGVRFSPYAFSRLRTTDALREFWLVSFKADLEADR